MGDTVHTTEMPLNSQQKTKHTELLFDLFVEFSPFVVDL